MTKGRSLSECQEAFPDEARCAAFLVRRRWPNGFVCPGGAGRRAAALKSRAYTYECANCGRQTSITAGTAMHRTRLPLTTWFWAAHLMATHSNGMSARQLEDQLGVTYKTAWLLTQKLRRSMVDPDREPLEGVVEVDQAEIPFRKGDAFFEPGSAGKIFVIGAVEVIDRDINQSKPRRRHAKYLDTRSGRVRLAMIADNSAASIEAFVRANVKHGTTLITDGHASYPGLTDYRHDPRVVGKMAGHVVLPWVHRVFALLKRWSLGTYHGLRRRHLNTYGPFYQPDIFAEIATGRGHVWVWARLGLWFERDVLAFLRSGQRFLAVVGRLFVMRMQVWRWSRPRGRQNVRRYRPDFQDRSWLARA